MPIREAELQIFAGEKTRMWTYGGTFPGPTIRRPAGHRTEVTFHHRLPRQVGELTVHLHGGHNRTQFDGQPGGLTKSQPKSFFCDIPRRPARSKESGNDFLLYPGGEQNLRLRPSSRTAGRSAPRSSGTTTTASTTPRKTSGAGWRGCGSSTTSSTRSLPLPRGDRDIPLMIAERTFDRHNQLTDPFTDRPPPADGITGHTGPRQRRLHAPPPGRRHSATGCGSSTPPRFRAYNLHLSNGDADDPDRRPTAA